MSEPHGLHGRNRGVRGPVASIGVHVLWRLLGMAAGAFGYAAEAGFELEMRRAALRNTVRNR